MVPDTLSIAASPQHNVRTILNIGFRIVSIFVGRLQLICYLDESRKKVSACEYPAGEPRDQFF